MEEIKTTLEKLSSEWSMFGSDPFIMEDVDKDRFSARNYVSSVTFVTI